MPKFIKLIKGFNIFSDCVCKIDVSKQIGIYIPPNKDSWIWCIDYPNTKMFIRWDNFKKLPKLVEAIKEVWGKIQEVKPGG